MDRNSALQKGCMLQSPSEAPLCDLATYKKSFKLLCQTDPSVASGASFELCERSVVLFSTHANNGCVFFFWQYIPCGK